MSAPIHRLARQANYDKQPVVEAGSASDCLAGWDSVIRDLRSTGARVLVIEAYPGVRCGDLATLVDGLRADLVIDAGEALRSEREIDQLVQPDLTNDPVFGRLTKLDLSDFFDTGRLESLRRRIGEGAGTVVVYGTGAGLITTGDLLVYAGMPRWEAQRRQRGGEAGNLGASNCGERPGRLYKRSYFIDWRVCDRHRRALWGRIHRFLDTTNDGSPRMIDSAVMARALRVAAHRPFRLVPFFDPAPWGGQWLKQVCDLPVDTTNYGWCFDCVPEENSLLLGFGPTHFEMPAIDLVYQHPIELLGRDVFDRWGAEFPIRFDFLDTIEGGNLSLQVHPLAEYIRAHFGVPYTQDESYYLMDVENGASVHLGVKSGIDRNAMIHDLWRSQRGERPFPVERYVNRFPAKRHDHFLIPAGTVHGSGAGSMVLEISATPYIFTFKLYDWDRPGLDGRRRPLHVDHGMRNIRFERDTAYAEGQLINRIVPLGSGDGWRCERTGLHEAEFIETHRHWFSEMVPHDTEGTVNVLNLVEGEEVLIESPGGGFDPFVVHYAETFIVPAAAAEYTIRPCGRDAGARHATIKAFVRPSAREGSGGSRRFGA